MSEFVVTKKMWEKQRVKEELPLKWFYYYFMLTKSPHTSFISLFTFERCFTIYMNNLIAAIKLTKPDVNVYEVTIHTIYNYFDKNLM